MRCRGPLRYIQIKTPIVDDTWYYTQALLLVISYTH